MDDLGGRIRQLMLELSARWGERVTLSQFGELVGKAEGRQGYTAQAVGAWTEGRNEPTLGAIYAMSRVTGWPEEPAWPPYRIAWGFVLSPGSATSRALVKDLPPSAFIEVDGVRESGRKSPPPRKKRGG